MSGDAVVFAQQAQQQVFGADVIVVEVARLFDRVLDHFLGSRRLGELAHGDHVRPGLHELLDLQANFAQIDVEVLQHIGADAGTFLDQSQQNVLGPDIFVVEALGFLVGQGHDFSSAIGEPFEHGEAPGCRLGPAGACAGRTQGT